MNTLYLIAKIALLPGTLGLLLLGLLAAWLLLRRPAWARAGHILLGLIFLSYAAMSVPIGACGIETMVASGYPRISDPRMLNGVQALVVLDGGSSRATVDDLASAVPVRASVERGLEAARLFRLMPQPPLVLVSGGAAIRPAGSPEGGALRQLLIDLGVPSNLAILDDSSLSTAESARIVPGLLRTRGVQQFALVTSAVHMRRAVRAFRAQTMTFVPAPAGIGCSGDWWWVPSPVALERSYQALYELAGLPYYALRGWLD